MSATPKAPSRAELQSSEPAFERCVQVLIQAADVRAFAQAVGETDPSYVTGQAVPPMFAAVYAALAVWPAVLAAVDGREPLLHFAQKFQWSVAVLPGDTISTRAWADGVTRRAGNEFHTFRSLSSNQRGEQVCCAVWTILIPQAPA